MAAIILDGRKIASDMLKTVKREIYGMMKKQKGALKLAVLQIGNNSSSEIYLNKQMKLASELGIKYCVKNLKSNTSQGSVEALISRLNSNKAITGIIIHTPTPKYIDVKRLFAKIAPHKDVEGLNPVNVGKLMYEKAIIAPCTASACMIIIDKTGIDLYGKEAVIVGHSEIVGKPLSLMLLSRMATTTVCHIGTYEKGLLREHVRRAELLIVSVGKPNLIKGSWIRKGAVVIDVGISRHKGKITGDVEFKSAKKSASYITPVPGGVGPLTTVMLMKNLVALYKNKRGLSK